jgi:hypothetical protein
MMELRDNNFHPNRFEPRLEYYANKYRPLMEDYTMRWHGNQSWGWWRRDFFDNRVNAIRNYLNNVRDPMLEWLDAHVPP